MTTALCTFAEGAAFMLGVVALALLVLVLRDATRAAWHHR
jgi:hypothetical protein